VGDDAILIYKEMSISAKRSVSTNIGLKRLETKVAADLYVTNKKKAYVVIASGSTFENKIFHADPEFGSKIQPIIDFFENKMLPIKMQPPIRKRTSTM
jgi:hypothetical protein